MTDNELPVTDGENTEEREKNLPAAEPATEAETDKKTVVYGEKVLTVKQRRIRTALRWLLINLGALMMAASVYFFQAPNEFTLGGVGGLSIMLSKGITPLVPWLTQAVIMGIINVVLLIIGFILLGRKSMLRTIVTTIAYTFEIWLFEFLDLIGLISGGTTLTNQPFLELVYAILLFGVGGALIFNCGSSSGGTDIIALILKKFTKINVGFALMIVDLIILCCSFFVFKDVQTGLYSFMGLFAKSFLLDSVIESIGKTKYITIITSNPAEIADYILNVINHSYTVYDAEGGYTGERKKVLVTVCKRGEALKLKTKVKTVDPSAFVIITDANEILGKGFGGTF